MREGVVSKLALQEQADTAGAGRYRILLVVPARRSRSQHRLLEKWLADYNRLRVGGDPRLPGEVSRRGRLLGRFANRFAKPSQ